VNVTSRLPGPQPDFAFASLLGSKIASSSARTVYEYVGQPDLVIKEALKEFPYSNWLEYIAWQQIKDEPNLVQVIGECHALSYSGKYLVMERLDDVPTTYTDRRNSRPGLPIANW